MTADYIAFHAAERPSAVALVSNGRPITYAEFSRDIRKFTQALREFEFPRGAKAAIECDDVYFHWLLRIAFEQLGVVTASFVAQRNPGPMPFLRDFDFVLSGTEIRTESLRRHQPITPQWLQGILARADAGEDPVPAKGPDDPLRILHTSGTTGIRKTLLYSRRIHERSVAKSIWFNGFTRHSRYLLAMSFAIGGSYANATACIRSGATVVVENRTTVERAIASHGITHATLPPFALKQIVDELPQDFIKPADLTIFSFGAPVPNVLRDRVLERLATDVCDMYGTNEAGFVSAARGRAEFGSVWPGVEVEVVDDGDLPLPFGEMGRIRVRTDCMVRGYLDDPVATGRMFRDGWFYAGDLGILHGPHRLQVIGRSDDLLNIGWNKFSPSTLEDLVLRAAEVGDVGVCSIPNADGIEEICIAVSDARASDQELLERITHAFRDLQLGRFRVVKVARVPRNANGKLQRNLLKDAAIRSTRVR